jgi:hypothetical protein
MNGKNLIPRSDSTGERGKIGWALAWLLGVPLPLLLIIYLFSRAC